MQASTHSVHAEPFSIDDLYATVIGSRDELTADVLYLEAAVLLQPWRSSAHPAATDRIT